MKISSVLKQLLSCKNLKKINLRATERCNANTEINMSTNFRPYRLNAYMVIIITRPLHFFFGHLYCLIPFYVIYDPMILSPWYAAVMKIYQFTQIYNNLYSTSY